MDSFIFPDDLQKHLIAQLHDGRTGFDTLKADADGLFDGRISDAGFKGADGMRMSFRLDGKPVKGVILSDWQKRMLDAGEVTVLQLAVHFCMSGRCGFARQRGLF